MKSKLIILTVIVVLLLGGFTVKGLAKSNEASRKLITTSYVVQEGDCLSTILNRYASYYDKLSNLEQRTMYINNMPNQYIQPGQKLIIQYYNFTE